MFKKNVVEETLKVEGMKCPHCAARVTEALKNIKVKSKVSLEEKQVVVKYNPEKVNKQDIEKAINDLGFKCL